MLFELEEIHRWRLDGEFSRLPESIFFGKLSNIFNIRKFFPDKNEDICKYYRSLLPWQFAIPDKNRTLLAVLQENFLEIRHKQDNYEKPVARTTIPNDKNPSWRKVCWSCDGVLVAFSTSEGELRCYNTLASLVCYIPKRTVDPNTSLPSCATASIFLIETRMKNENWPYELLSLDFRGNLKSYMVSSTEGYKPYHVFSFEDSISMATYIPSFNMLVIAFPDSSSVKQSIKAWRLLNEHPYYQSFDSNSESEHVYKKIYRLTSLMKINSERNVILKMSASLFGTYLACIYSCGSIIIWTLPALRIHKIWHSKDISSCLRTGKKEIVSAQENSVDYFPTDINWCSDTKLAIINQSNKLVVSNIDKLKNILAKINSNLCGVDDNPIHLNDQSQLANICDITDGLLILNCKQEKTGVLPKNPEFFDSESKAKEPQKEHPYVDKIYTLIILKEVTAQELYERKINNSMFEEALKFAELFSLDKNQVYKKQWESEKPLTLELMKNCLFKVTDKWWTIEECCSEVPETLSAAEKLLTYGLQLTDFNAFLSLIDTGFEDTRSNSMYDYFRSFQLNLNLKQNHYFSFDQLRILGLRKLLLLYWDALNVYKEILEFDENIAYNEEIFSKFRTESPMHIALYFARRGRTKAVIILFRHYFECLSPHWLEILNNIPECMSPIYYQELLPKFDNTNQLGKWERHCTRVDDWSESGEFRNLIQHKLAETKSSLIGFDVSREIIIEWYKCRIKKIVEISGLMENGIELLNVASKNNIKLEYLQHNLLVADALAYESTNTEEISLYEIEKLTPSEQLKLLIRRINITDNFLYGICTVLVPFLNRCEVLWPYSRDRLLAEFLEELSKNDLNVFLTFLNYVRCEPEVICISNETISNFALLSIYACERTDQIDLVREIIDNLPRPWNNKLDELQLELTVVEKLQRYAILKNVSDIHKIKDNVQFQKALLICVINAKIARTKLLSKEEIYELLQDLMFIQENLFNSLPNQTYLRMFAYTILTTGWQSCIEEYAPLVFCRSSDHLPGSQEYVLSYEDSVAVIIESAQYYLNNASSCHDPGISLAKSCLSLIDFHPIVEQEKQFINALMELKVLEVQISPLEVKMSGNKMKIIELALKTRPDSYKHFNNLMTLARNLQVDEENGNALKLDTINLAINAAFEAKDYLWCSKTASAWLRDANGCWDVCRKVCECEEFDDLNMKCRLIKSVISWCPDHEIHDTLRSRNKLEVQFLRKCLQGNDSSHCSLLEADYQFYGNFVSQFPAANLSDSNFWSTAFDFPQKNDLYETESDLFICGDKLIFSEFNADVHKNCDCLCQLNKVVVEESRNIQFLLRYFLLFQENQNALNSRIFDVIAELAVKAFYTDCISSLCLFLLLTNSRACDQEIFASLPKTASVVKFALYYYCLKFLNSTESGKENITVIIERPSKFWTMSIIQTQHSPFIRCIRNYKYLLDCGEVDFERFFTDDVYRMDSILGTAMYPDRHKLELAVLLGSEYGVSKVDIIICHISSLFFSNSLTILTERLKEQIILETLKENANYATQRIHSSIYDGLPGNDYQILILYYALLKHLAEDKIINGLKPNGHIKLLKRLRTFSKTIDYKLLTSNSFQGWRALSYAVPVDEPCKYLDILTNLLSTLNNDHDLRSSFVKLFEKSYESGHELIIEKLKEYSKHVTKFSQLYQICDKCNLNIKYSRKLQSAFKFEDDRGLNEIISEMILDSLISTDVIQMITDEIKSDLLTRTIDHMLKQITNQSEIKLILRRIVDCIEANEYDKSWCDLLHSLLGRNELTEHNRSYIIKILSILKRSDEDINCIVDLLHNSKLILREWISVHSNITVFDVADENSRLLLAKELVKRSNCFLHLTCIYEMLSFWPPFSLTNDIETDPYQFLLQKLLIQDQKSCLAEEEIKLVQKIASLRQFNKEGVSLPKNIGKYLSKKSQDALDDIHDVEDFRS